jgi:hypothetical protein
MRRVVAVVALAVLLPAGAAGAAARRVTAPGPVTALAFDGIRVAYASGRSRGDCDRVRIWNLRTGNVIPLGRTTSCIETSTGTGIAAVSIAGSRVLWLHYTGGNFREWSLFTATAATPRPRLLRFVTREVDGPAPIVVGEGDSGRGATLLPYAVDHGVVALRADGTRAFTWTAPERVTAVAARGKVLAVALADGRIVVHDLALGSSNEIVGTAAASAVFVTTEGIVAQSGRTVELRGRRGYVATLPARAVLRDADGVRVLYTVAGRAKQLDLRTHQTRDLGAGNYAQLEGRKAAAATGRVVRIIAP